LPAADQHNADDKELLAADQHTVEELLAAAQYTVEELLVADQQVVFDAELRADQYAVYDAHAALRKRAWADGVAHISPNDQAHDRRGLDTDAEVLLATA